jgi:hypothetical protein
LGDRCCDTQDALRTARTGPEDLIQIAAQCDYRKLSTDALARGYCRRFQRVTLPDLHLPTYLAAFAQNKSPNRVRRTTDFEINRPPPVDFLSVEIDPGAAIERGAVLGKIIKIPALCGALQKFAE